MSISLTIIFSFFFGLMLGSGIIGGIIGWWLAAPGRVAATIAFWLKQDKNRWSLLDYATTELELEHSRLAKKVR